MLSGNSKRRQNMRIYKVEYIDRQSFKNKTVNVLADSRTMAVAWVESRFNGMVTDVWEA